MSKITVGGITCISTKVKQILLLFTFISLFCIFMGLNLTVFGCRTKQKTELQPVTKSEMS